MERARRKKDEKRIAELEAELDCGEFPEALAYLWRTFLRLHARRGNNGFGLSPISWADIDALERHSGFKLAPWEIELVEELDGLFLSEQAKRAQRDSGDKGATNKR